MEAREIKERFDGIKLTYDDYCAFVEWLGYPDTEECGLSGFYPGYHWEVLHIDGYEINVYWL